MHVRNKWWERAWAWCVEAARETAKGWRGAVALLRRESLRPLALIAVFFFLPSLLGILVPQAAGFFALVRGFVCMPLLFAALARVQLTALGGGRAPLVDTVRETALQWRELLLLALFGLMLEQMGSFVAGSLSQLLLGLMGLITWIPLLGWLLGAVFSALVAMLVLFVSLLLSQSIYFAWLSRESERTPALLTLSTAWGFIKEHARPIVGLYVCFAIAGGALMLLHVGWYALLWWSAALNALIWLLGTSYAAALYASDKGARVHDAHSAPIDLDSVKRANIPED
ncbi:MAG: hypothetical protein FWE77_04490 [Clostridia bacterium]|nr:hypothetical protein [Clostridia bacterium]